MFRFSGRIRNQTFHPCETGGPMEKQASDERWAALMAEGAALFDVDDDRGTELLAKLRQQREEYDKLVEELVRPIDPPEATP